MIKRILPFVISLIALPPYAVNAGPAEIKLNVDNYITQQREVMELIRDDVTLQGSEVMKVGSGNALKNDMGLTHMIEVIKLIEQGLLDECCWNAVPKVYSHYVNLTTSNITGRDTVINPAYSPDDSDYFYTPSLGFSNKMFSMLSQARDATKTDLIRRTLADQPYRVSSFDFIDALVNDVSGAGTLDDSVIANTIWVHSYIQPEYHDAGFVNDFTDYYVWSCLVCLGAGFYDTAGMFDEDGQPNQYYAQIVNASNLPLSYDWLLTQDPEGFAAVPLQTSIGPTFEAMEAEYPEGDRDPSVVYSSHCHEASELYVALDSMDLDNAAGTGVLADQTGKNYDNNGISTFGTQSFIAGNPNYHKRTVVFGDSTAMGALAAQPITPFQNFRSGDLGYNAAAVKHAMHPGTRFQMAAWTRLNRPYEGTYFPDEDAKPIAPPSFTCLDEAALSTK